MKLAVVGDQEFVTGFMLAGITDLYEVKDEKQLVEAIRELLNRKDIGIVAVQQELMKKLPTYLKREVYESVEPTFIAVGGSEEVVEEIREKIRKAIGVDLWK
ncbi:MAG: V-type ATP synthase subunit F [Archaeoglobaceae archaeon]|nr:V-type ATP synthase subunit F [Archaeoglobaceae archaeon]MCX8152468.1 V-type ATP synthase subunit F [Archaeoglobaceae archaeon]MDW8013808.1 V-type ATP synthase subunit F [Archaeoglobaceae archaeon]